MSEPTIWAFDIETTGLMPAKPSDKDENIRHTLLGVASIYGIHQYAAFNVDEEKRAIEQFNSDISAHYKPEDIVITYNGRSFDFPFGGLRSKLIGISVEDTGFGEKHVDLMGYAKKMNGNRFISKDYFFSKFLNIYVPKNVSGAYLAKGFTEEVNVRDLMQKNILHNAIDLATTLEAYDKLMQYKDFQSYVKEELQG